MKLMTGKGSAALSTANLHTVGDWRKRSAYQPATQKAALVK